MKKILIIISLFLITLNAKERLVVLDPASIETLFMLKAEDQIVGIATLQHSNIYPKDQTSKLTSVGTFSNPSLENSSIKTKFGDFKLLFFKFRRRT